MIKDYQAPAGLLNNRTLLITGAGDGIGKAVAIGSARAGARVILLGRTQNKLEQVYDIIREQYPDAPEPVIHPLDLVTAGKDDYDALAQAILEQFGCLDALLHNAGLLGPLSPMQYYPEDVWTKLMQVNVNAAFALSKAVLPALNVAPDARLLFTSSSVGRQGRAYWGAYAVSKFAVEGMMQVFAQELENTSTIRVNSINPGATRTEMRAAAYPSEDPASLPTPEDLLPAYLYLLGPESRPLHGQAINIRDMITL